MQKQLTKQNQELLSYTKLLQDANTYNSNQMMYYVNHLVKELQSIHENRLELANKLQLAMNSNTVSIIICHIAYSLYYTS